MSIKLLDPFLTTQIAAGEVIERPASVVKELLENSLDANCKRLEIEINKGGSDLIRVRDDGIGIDREDLPLSIMRYATSKIESLTDLEHIFTLGFRGEALASISSVSRFTLASRRQGENVGWQINVAGKNSEAEISPVAHPFGTSVEVRDLFFNTPVRRKFLRSEKTEFRQIEEIVCRLALSRFDVAFVLKHNDRINQQLDIANSHQEKRERIAALCGDEFDSQSLTVAFERHGLKLSGWISKPSFTRSQADLQYFYINGRMVRDKLLTHAVRQAYRDVLMHGRQPAFVLYLELNPELVDVNVHPTKMEVRFRDSQTVHSFLVFCIKQALAERLNNPVVSMLDRDEAVDLYIRQVQKKPIPVVREREEYNTQRSALKSKLQLPEQLELPFTIAEESRIYNTSCFENGNKNLPIQDLGYALAQLNGTYILAQNSLGLVIVDIHAAHERITYEHLKRAYADAKLTAQNLLPPLTLSVNKKEAACAEEFKNELQKCGLEIESFSADTLIVRKMPALIKAADNKQFIYDLLADLSEFETTAGVENYIDKILASFACHHSVRAKQRLSPEEMNALLRQLEQTERGAQCSHGRPTWIQIPFDKIAKMFGRS